MEHKFWKYCIVVMATFLFSSCADRQDPNFQWLIAVLQPVAPAGNTVVTPSQQTDPQNSEMNPTLPPTAVPIPFSIEAHEIEGNTDFLFQNTSTFPLRIQVRDYIAPVQGSLVQIRERGGAGSQILFSAVTDPNGNVTGAFTIINRAEPKIVIEITYQGNTYFFEMTLWRVIEVNRDIVLDFRQAIPTVNPDSDRDTVPDQYDAYPNDPTRSAKIRIPTDSYYTVAYEDLYPRPGDADFNDYVVRVYNEEDLDAQGRVVRIRGNYTHVAKGAGYNHTLNLRFPQEVNGSYSITRKKPNGTVYLKETKTLDNTKTIAILPQSNTTIQQANTDRRESFLIGDVSEFEMILDAPVEKIKLGKCPYDLFLYVVNTNLEIHFLGFHKNADGTDQYLDRNGFPWALLVPGDFTWPLEREDIHKGYPNFETWYSSLGQNFLDWYNTKVETFLFMSR